MVERVKSRIDDPQEPTTADAYGQPVVQNQTEEGVIDKKIERDPIVTGKQCEI